MENLKLIIVIILSEWRSIVNPRQSEKGLDDFTGK
jgi:hypothetical protein